MTHRPPTDRGKLAALLVVAAIAAIQIGVRTWPRTTQGAPPAPAPIAPPTAAPPRAYMPIPVTWERTVPRDPFAPRPQPPPPPPPQDTTPHQAESTQSRIERTAREALALTSVTVGASTFAVINGQVVQRGDHVAGFLVLHIDEHGVIVEREGARVALAR